MPCRRISQQLRLGYAPGLYIFKKLYRRRVTIQVRDFLGSFFDQVLILLQRLNLSVVEIGRLARLFQLLVNASDFVGQNDRIVRDVFVRRSYLCDSGANRRGSSSSAVLGLT